MKSLMRFRTVVYAWLCFQVIVSACAIAPSSSSTQEQQADKTDQGANDPEATGFFNGTPKEQREAWRLFIQDGEYRAAYFADFSIPDSVRKARGSDLQRAIERPYVGGDLNNDGAYNDFAIIVVNTKRNDPERFGIVIFNEPLNDQGPYESYWLYQDRDLSSTALEWWSGGLAIREYHQDGTYGFCYVNWNPQKKLYSCDATTNR